MNGGIRIPNTFGALLELLHGSLMVNGLAFPHQSIVLFVRVGEVTGGVLSTLMVLHARLRLLLGDLI